MGTQIIERPATATYKFLWKIDRFSELYSNNILEHESDVFSAGGAKWKAQMYPRGYGEVFDHLALFLCRADSAKYPVKASFNFAITSQTNHFCTTENDVSLGIKSESGTRVMETTALCPPTKRNPDICEKQFTTANQASGFHKFVSLRRLHNPSSGYILDDTLKIYIEITCEISANADKPVKEEPHT